MSEEHTSDWCQDDEGWTTLTCSCGWGAGAAYPSAEDAGDAWGDHKAEATRKEADFWKQELDGLSACLGFLFQLSEGTTEYELEPDDEIVSTDTGWRVTVDDGNGAKITGRFYPLSSVHKIAEFLGWQRP